MKCRISFWTQKPLAIAAAFLRFRATPIPTEFKMTERDELRAATYVCDRLDMSLATLDRRLADPRSDLPRPVTKCGRARMWRKRIDKLSKRVAALEAGEPEQDSFPPTRP